MVAALTSYELAAIVVVIIVSILVIGVLLYLRRRLRERRAQLLGQLKDRPDLTRDRAFNRLAMARREADIIAGQGIDVARPRELIAQSQAAFDSREFERAYELAQQSHEALVHAQRDRRPLASSAPPAPAASHASPSSRTAVLASAASLTGVSTVATAATTLPKNRAESQFQLRLLDQELASARAQTPKDLSLANAEGYRADAGAAFDRGDYTDAFRLALRGRRAIGASIESLPVVGTTALELSADGDERGAVDAARSAEMAAGADRCPKCGYPSLPGDSFCRGCGEPRAAAACSHCGLPRQPADTFCGRCGSAFA